MLASARGIPFALRDTVNSVVGVRLRNAVGYVLPMPLWPNCPIRLRRRLFLSQLAQQRVRHIRNLRQAAHQPTRIASTHLVEKYPDDHPSPTSLRESF